MSVGEVRHFFRVMESDAPAHEEMGWDKWGTENILSMPHEGVAVLEWTGKGEPKLPDDADSHDGSETVKRATAWLAEVSKILIRKNRKYGDSAANPMRVFSKASPVEQLLVRIDDKLSRIARGDGLLDTDEDVLRDLVGYLALLAAMKTDKQEK